MAKSMVEMISGMTPEQVTEELERLRGALKQAQDDAAARSAVQRPTRWGLSKNRNGYVVLYLSGAAALAVSPPQFEELQRVMAGDRAAALREWWSGVRGEANSLYLAHRAAHKAAKAGAPAGDEPLT